MNSIFIFFCLPGSVARGPPIPAIRQHCQAAAWEKHCCRQFPRITPLGETCTLWPFSLSLFARLVFKIPKQWRQCYFNHCFILSVTAGSSPLLSGCSVPKCVPEGDMVIVTSPICLWTAVPWLLWFCSCYVGATYFFSAASERGSPSLEEN